jgi:hypothetical protein
MDDEEMQPNQRIQGQSIPIDLNVLKETSIDV